MDSVVRDLRALAQTYFDAAYAMDADVFASIFHRAASVTKLADDGEVSVVPIDAWLTAVRGMQAPSERGLERRDEVLAIDVVRDLALVKLTLQVPPRCFTDLLSCLKVNGRWKIVQKVMTVESR